MISEVLSPIWDRITNYLNTHPLIGWIVALVVIIILLLIFLGNIFPKCEIIKSRIYLPLSKRLRFRGLVKRAIKSEIRGHVNSVVMELQNELPEGWIREMEIEWVEKETKEDFLESDDIVIRMRPLEHQGLNFVTATYYFFKKALFPKTKSVIPEVHRETSALYICRRLINTKRKEYKKDFEDNILENAIQKKETILNYLERYEYLDNHGFFTGTFLREVHEIATIVRFTEMRKKMPQEVDEILKHIEGFIKNIGPGIPDQEWYRFGPITSYSFLLIANPGKVIKGIKPYIKRVKNKFNSGATRLYVFGAASENRFAKYIINGICKQIPECELKEIFKLSYDYRGNKGGIGALFCLKQKNIANERM